MSTQNVAEEVNSCSRWSIFIGIATTALGYFLIVYAIATAMKEPFEKKGQPDPPRGNQVKT